MDEEAMWAGLEEKEDDVEKLVLADLLEESGGTKDLATAYALRWCVSWDKWPWKADIKDGIAIGQDGRVLVRVRDVYMAPGWYWDGPKDRNQLPNTVMVAMGAKEARKTLQEVIEDLELAIWEMRRVCDLGGKPC